MPALIPDITDDDSVYQTPCEMMECAAVAPDELPTHRNAGYGLRRCRELEGRCGDCGIQTHEVKHDPSSGNQIKVPITIEQEVLRGRCLFCHPVLHSQLQSPFPTARLACQSPAPFDPRNALAIIDSDNGDIVDVLSAMRLHPYEEVLQRGCEKLWVHSWDDETASALGRVGGIPTILDAMTRYPMNTRLQQSACETLQNLAINDFNRDVILELGGASMIAEAMMRHMNVSAIQLGGCSALANLAFLPEHKKYIVGTGGLHAIVLAARHFPGDEDVSQGVSHALKSLGYEPASVMSC